MFKQYFRITILLAKISTRVDLMTFTIMNSIYLSFKFKVLNETAFGGIIEVHSLFFEIERGEMWGYEEGIRDDREFFLINS